MVSNNNGINMGEGKVPKKKLTDKEETFCQLRASGYTKSKAARIAYDTKYPSKMGWQVEQQKMVRDRIAELKEELAEASGITYEGQAAKYHELYLMALEQGDIKNATAILQRLDALAGLDVKRSEVTKKTIGDNLKDKDGDVSKDLEKFPTILGKHSEEVVH